MQDPPQELVQDMAQASPRTRPRVVMGLLFFPRGGSAHVARALAGALPAHGWDVTLVSGSLSLPGGQGNAQTFYAGLDPQAVDFTTALAAPDPLRADPPLSPSYEDRPGAPDRVFARLDDAAYECQVAAWAKALRAAGAAEADVFHLHHLTPLHAAARQVAPHVPIVGHLHGTELLMLEAIAAGPPDGWDHAAAWEQRLRDWAHVCQRLLVPSATAKARAQTLLRIDAERIVQVPNGFDPQRFHPLGPHPTHPVDRQALWRRVLVEQPRGWRPGRAPGSVAYRRRMLRSFKQGTVLLYVGRFTAVKHIDVLIRAYVRARPAFISPAPLVLVGGFPGEWEGDHPFDVIRRHRARDVFLAGWHDHDELPDLFAAADVVALPSVREQFGLTLVEGMACGLPVIAVDGDHGPREIVADGETGWLVPPDDEHALAQALVQAVNHGEERRRRGTAALAAAHARYGWPALGAQLAGIYGGLLGPPPWA